MLVLSIIRDATVIEVARCKREFLGFHISDNVPEEVKFVFQEPVRSAWGQNWAFGGRGDRIDGF